MSIFFSDNYKIGFTPYPRCKSITQTAWRIRLCSVIYQNNKKRVCPLTTRLKRRYSPSQ